MKFSSLAIFLVVFSSTEGNGYLGRVHDLSRKVVANLHSGIKELGNVASIVAGDLSDGFKTVSKVHIHVLSKPKIITKEHHSSAIDGNPG